jgi:hypothetical protein
MGRDIPLIIYPPGCVDYPLGYLEYSVGYPGAMPVLLRKDTHDTPFRFPSGHDLP